MLGRLMKLLLLIHFALVEPLARGKTGVDSDPVVSGQPSTAMPTVEQQVADNNMGLIVKITDPPADDASIQYYFQALDQEGETVDVERESNNENQVTITDCHIVKVRVWYRRGNVVSPSTDHIITGNTLKKPPTPTSKNSRELTQYKVTLNDNEWFQSLTNKYVTYVDCVPSEAVSVTGNEVISTKCEDEKIKIYAENECGHRSDPLTIDLRTELTAFQPPVVDTISLGSKGVRVGWQVPPGGEGLIHEYSFQSYDEDNHPIESGFINKREVELLDSQGVKVIVNSKTRCKESTNARAKTIAASLYPAPGPPTLNLKVLSQTKIEASWEVDTLGVVADKFKVTIVPDGKKEFDEETRQLSKTFDVTSPSTIKLEAFGHNGKSSTAVIKRLIINSTPPTVEEAETALYDGTVVTVTNRPADSQNIYHFQALDESGTEVGIEHKNTEGKLTLKDCRIHKVRVWYEIGDVISVPTLYTILSSTFVPQPPVVNVISSGTNGVQVGWQVPSGGDALIYAYSYKSLDSDGNSVETGKSYIRELVLKNSKGVKVIVNSLTRCKESDGAIENSVDASYYPAPDPPTLYLAVLSQTKVEASWEVDNLGVVADKFRVTIVPDGKYEFYEETKEFSRTLDVTGPSTIKLEAFGHNGEKSDAVTERLIINVIVPTVEEQVADNNKGLLVKVTNPPDDGTNEYHFRAFDKEGNEVDVESNTNNEGQLTLTDCRIAKVRVWSKRGDVISPQTDYTITGNTLKEPPTPTSKNSRELTQYKVTLNDNEWFQPLTNKYVTYIDGMRGKAVSVTGNEVISTKCEVEFIEIYAENECGHKSYTLLIDLTTELTVPKPPVVNVISSGTNGVQVGWQVPSGGDALIYAYSYKSLDSDGNPIETGKSYIRELVLKNSKGVKVIVNSLTRCKESTGAIEKSIDASLYPAPKPPILNVVSLSQTEIKASWEVDDSGVVADKFIITIVSDNGSEIPYETQNLSETYEVTNDNTIKLQAVGHNGKKSNPVTKRLNGLVTTPAVKQESS